MLSKIQHDILKRKCSRDSPFILKETICSDMKAALVCDSLRSLFSSTV